MSFSESVKTKALSKRVDVLVGTLAVDLVDGRCITVPIDWFPRLAEGSPAERSNWELTGAGTGIHWPDLDEDISIEGLLAGHRSMESEASLEKWRRSRK